MPTIFINGEEIDKNELSKISTINCSMGLYLNDYSDKEIVNTVIQNKGVYQYKKHNEIMYQLRLKYPERIALSIPEQAVISSLNIDKFLKCIDVYNILHLREKLQVDDEIIVNFNRIKKLLWVKKCKKKKKIYYKVIWGIE